MSRSLAEEKNASLLDVLDSALDKGVVVSGDATISVAGVDLIYLGLRALLSSVQTAEEAGWWCGARAISHQPTGSEGWRPNAFEASGNAAMKRQIEEGPASPSALAHQAPGQLAPEPPRVNNALPSHIDADPERVQQGLAKLVLTLIELIRRLMERQAIRRAEGGSLTEDEMERMGLTFMRLEEKMTELKRVFGLKDSELNIDLGPLGNLI